MATVQLTTSRLALRVYVEASDFATAFALASDLTARLMVIAPVRECRVYPYWKFADHFGLWLDIAPQDDKAFDAILALIAPSWEDSGPGPDRWAVWNRATHGGDPLMPAITWASVEPCG